jgi:hypothetical protein
MSTTIFIYLFISFLVLKSTKRHPTEILYHARQHKLEVDEQNEAEGRDVEGWQVGAGMQSVCPASLAAKIPAYI